jgi:hypothetical protein
MSLTFIFHEALQRLVLTIGVQLGITSRHEPPRRDFQRHEASRVASYSKKSVPWHHDLSRRRLPRRFVPMSEGDAQFL